MSATGHVEKLPQPKTYILHCSPAPNRRQVPHRRHTSLHGAMERATLGLKIYDLIMLCCTMSLCIITYKCQDPAINWHTILWGKFLHTCKSVWFHLPPTPVYFSTCFSEEPCREIINFAKAEWVDVRESDLSHALCPVLCALHNASPKKSDTSHIVGLKFSILYWQPWKYVCYKIYIYIYK